MIRRSDRGAPIGPNHTVPSATVRLFARIPGNKLPGYDHPSVRDKIRCISRWQKPFFAVRSPEKRQHVVRVYSRPAAPQALRSRGPQRVVFLALLLAGLSFISRLG